MLVSLYSKHYNVIASVGAKTSVFRYHYQNYHHSVVAIFVTAESITVSLQNSSSQHCGQHTCHGTISGFSTMASLLAPVSLQALASQCCLKHQYHGISDIALFLILALRHWHHCQYQHRGGIASVSSNTSLLPASLIGLASECYFGYHLHGTVTSITTLVLVSPSWQWRHGIVASVIIMASLLTSAFPALMFCWYCHHGIIASFSIMVLMLVLASWNHW